MQLSSRKVVGADYEEQEYIVRLRGRRGNEPLRVGAVLRLTPPDLPAQCPLSKRQFEVLQYLAQGLTYREIGAQMHLQLSSVRTHIHYAYRKFGVSDRVALVLMAVEQGWI